MSKFSILALFVVIFSIGPGSAGAMEHGAAALKETNPFTKHTPEHKLHCLLLGHEQGKPCPKADTSPQGSHRNCYLSSQCHDGKGGIPAAVNWETPLYLQTVGAHSSPMAYVQLLLNRQPSFPPDPFSEISPPPPRTL